jgi:hypothetical protein
VSPTRCTYDRRLVVATRLRTKQWNRRRTDGGAGDAPVGPTGDVTTIAQSETLLACLCFSPSLGCVPVLEHLPDGGAYERPG